MGNDRGPASVTDMPRVYTSAESSFVAGQSSNSPVGEQSSGNPYTKAETYTNTTEPSAVSYTSTDGQPVQPQVEQPRDEQNLRTGFEMIADEVPSNGEFVSVLDPAINKANDIVNKLRLKSVGVKGFTETDQKRLESMNQFIAFNYARREELMRLEETRKQEQIEMQKVAEAQSMVTQIEQRLNGVDINLADTADLKAALEDIASGLHISIEELIKKLPNINATLAAKLLSASQAPAPVTSTVTV